jgi:hypothetical protein
MNFTYDEMVELQKLLVKMFQMHGDNKCAEWAARLEKLTGVSIGHDGEIQ